MRLIDADSIPWFVEGVGEIPVITKEEIDQMPEAIIRCKDCIWEEETRGWQKWCKWHYFHTNDYEFCSWAERKEDDQTD